MKKSTRTLGRIVLGLIVLVLLAIAINDADAIPFIYQAAASIVLIAVGLICLRRSNRDRPRPHEPLIR